jgi:dihydroneopterin aldolase
MTDRIVLIDLHVEGRHGVHDWERVTPQLFEVDVELLLDLRPAGTTDDLGRTIDYSVVYEDVRSIVEGPGVALIETLAESIAEALLARHPADEVIVRVRKPGVGLGPIGYAGVEVSRRRTSR